MYISIRLYHGIFFDNAQINNDGGSSSAGDWPTQELPDGVLVSHERKFDGLPVSNYYYGRLW